MEHERKQPKPYGAPKWYETALGGPVAILGGTALLIALIVLVKDLIFALAVSVKIVVV